MLVARSGEVTAAYETSRVLGRGSFGAWAHLGALAVAVLLAS